MTGRSFVRALLLVCQGLADGKYYVLEGVSVGGAQGSGTVSLTYRPETHASGDFTVRAHVVSQETGAANTVTSTVEQTMHVDAVNSGYNLTVGNAAGQEDRRIPIQVGGTGLVDTDGSEQVVSATLTNVPDDYKVFVGADAGSAQEAQNVGGGTWALTLTPDGKLPGYIAVQAPLNISETAKDVKLTVYSGEKGQTAVKANEAVFDVKVQAVADGLTIDPTQTFGKAGESIPIHLNATVKDTDGSETVTVALKGLGKDVTFNHGTAAYDAVTDTYTVSGIAHNKVPQLAFTKNAPMSGTVNVTAKTVETSNGDTSAEVSGIFQVDIKPGTAPSGIIGRSAFFSASSLTEGTEEAEPLFDADGNLIDLNLDSAAALDASLLGEGTLSEGIDAEADAAIDEAAALLSVDAEMPNTDIPDLPDTEDSGTNEPAEGTPLPDLAGGAADTSASVEELAGTADLPAPDPIDTVDTGTEAGTSADSVPDLDDAPLTEVADATPAGTMSEPGPDLDDVPSADAAEDAPELGGVPAEDSLDLNGVADMGAADEGAPELGGLTADDVLDVGGGDLPLPGDDAPEAIPEVESAPEFYAPPVPDAAMTIAQEMDNAIQP